VVVEQLCLAVLHCLLLPMLPPRLLKLIELPDKHKLLKLLRVKWQPNHPARKCLLSPALRQCGADPKGALPAGLTHPNQLQRSLIWSGPNSSLDSTILIENWFRLTPRCEVLDRSLQNTPNLPVVKLQWPRPQLGKNESWQKKQ
jgi:hypothetical protein